MGFELTESQKRALDWRRSQCVIAGAGSGKTSVLSDRYLKILLDNEDCEVFNVLALTFTNKAANEMKSRLLKKISNLSSNVSDMKLKSRLRTLEDDLPYAPISTIHHFCASLLREYSIELGIDPLFSIVDMLQKSNLELLAIDSALLDVSDNPNHPLFGDLEFVSKFLSRSRLSEIFFKLFRMRPMPKTFSSEHLPNSSLTLLQGLSADEKEFEEMHHKYVFSILKLFEYIMTKYSSLMGDGKQLDFAHLEEKTAELFTHKFIREKIRSQYRFILVDEFQDTNFIQWDILRPVIFDEGGSISGNVFVVGDPQQSIYGFRGADVRVFNEAKEQILSQNMNNREFKSEEIILNENFRSRPEIIAFINHFFQRASSIDIFREDAKAPPDIVEKQIQKYRINFHPLKCGGSFPEELKPAGVSFLIHTQDVPNKREYEANLIAEKILEITASDSYEIYDFTSPRKIRKPKFKDIAILLRAGGYAQYYEGALKKKNIPVISSVSAGYYMREEIADIISLIRFLSDKTLDISLVSILRSPFFAFPDSLLAHIAGIGDKEELAYYDKLLRFAAEPQKYPSSNKNFDSWIALVRQTFGALEKWRASFNKISLAEFLWGAFGESGVWLTYSYGEMGEQRIANLNKLKSMIYNYESQNGINWMEFVEEVLSRGRDEGIKEGEAPVIGLEKDAVLITTIHSVKGLEFPIVFVADCTHEFNFGTRDILYSDPDLGIGIEIPDKNADYALCSSKQRDIIIEANRCKTILEEQRLFYVALTRAKDFLFLSGYLPKRQKAYSFVRFLSNVFGEDLYNDAIDKISFVWDDSPYEIDICRMLSGKSFTVFADGNSNTRNLSIDNADESLESNMDITKYLGKISPEKSDINFSVTSLMTFNDCPRRYFFQYMLGMISGLISEDEDFGNEAASQSVMQKKNHGLDFGILAHKIFSNVVRSRDIKTSEIVSKSIKEFEIDGGKTLGYMAVDLQNITEKFIASELYKRISCSSDILCESAFDMEISGGYINGILDLLYRSAEGWEIVDFKTNKVASEKIAELAGHYRLQMLIYSLFVLRSNRKQEKVRATLYFTNPGKEYVFDFERKDEVALEGEITHIIDKICKGEFIKGNGANCEFCQFRHKSFCGENGDV